MRAAVYVRISKDREGTQVGVKRQEKDARKLARDRGWEVAEIFSDDDVSAGGKRKRPGWERLLATIEDGQVDALVAYSSSRLYRRPADLQRLIALTAERGLDIATVASGNIDLDTADGRMLAGILAEVDQRELDVLTERVTRAMLSLSESGVRWGGRRPFGYDVTGKPKSKGGEGVTLKVNRKEARVIQQGVQMVMEGAGPHRVALAWNEAGSTTPSGRPWSTTRVREVLSSALIAGLREHRRTGAVVEGTWPAIISPEEHRTVRAMLRPKKTGKVLVRRHVLSGILRCGKCGTGMTGRTDAGGRRSYACGHNNGGCGGVLVNAIGAEDAVLDEVFGVDPKYLQKVVLAQPRAVTQEAVKRLGQIAKERTTLADAGALGVNVASQLAALTKEEREIQSAMAPTAATTLPKDDKERRDRRHAGQLTEAEVLQTAAWVRALVDHVDVRAAKHTREAPADRLRIIWR